MRVVTTAICAAFILAGSTPMGSGAQAQIFNTSEETAALRKRIAGMEAKHRAACELAWRKRYNDPALKFTQWGPIENALLYKSMGGLPAKRQGRFKDNMVIMIGHTGVFGSAGLNCVFGRINGQMQVLATCESGGNRQCGGWIK